MDECHSSQTAVPGSGFVVPGFAEVGIEQGTVPGSRFEVPGFIEVLGSGF
jgi:hypothetical protein